MRVGREEEYRGHTLRAVHHPPQWQVNIIGAAQNPHLPFPAADSEDEALARARALIDEHLGSKTSAELQREQLEQFRATLDRLISDYEERIVLEERTVAALESGELRLTSPHRVFQSKY